MPGAWVCCPHTLAPAMSAKPQPPKKRAAKPAAAAAAEPTPTSLRETCEAAWRVWDAASIRAACEAADYSQAATQAEVLMWLGMSSFMCEGTDALAHLDEAFRLCTASNDDGAAAAVVLRALAIAVLDIRAKEDVPNWLARWDLVAANLSNPAANEAVLWLRLAPMAAQVLGGKAHGMAESAALALQLDFRRLNRPWSPDERLMAEQVLIDYQFTCERYEAFEVMANAVERSPLFGAGSAFMRARWLYTYGYSQHLTSQPENAERAWLRAMDVAKESKLEATALTTSLALAKGYLKQGQVDKAAALVEGVQAQSGLGRMAQLVELLQLRARVQLCRGNLANAKTLLQDAVKTAQAASLNYVDFAGCITDLAQVHVAGGYLQEAERTMLTLLESLHGRNAELARCQLMILQAYACIATNGNVEKEHLKEGLALAHKMRFFNFLLLLPEAAAAVCAAALSANIQPEFIFETIQARALPAPPDAGTEWPWPLWIQLLGRFEIRVAGTALVHGGKAPQKPLELLRLLACQRQLSLSLSAVADSLWPDSDAASARKSFDVTVHRLRPLLGDASLLWVSDGQVGLDRARVSSDLSVRRRLIDKLESLAVLQNGKSNAVGTTTVESCVALIGRVVELSRGNLLQGATDTPWLLAEQQLCRSDTVRAAMAAASVLSFANAGEAERELLETALRIEPLSETLALRLMQTYEHSARNGDALRVFETYRRQITERGGRLGAPIQARWSALLNTINHAR